MFAAAVSGAGSRQQSLAREVSRLQQSWRARLSGPRDRALRADAAPWNVLVLIPGTWS